MYRETLGLDLKEASLLISNPSNRVFWSKLDRWPHHLLSANGSLLTLASEVYFFLEQLTFKSVFWQTCTWPWRSGFALQKKFLRSMKNVPTFPMLNNSLECIFCWREQDLKFSANVKSVLTLLLTYPTAKSCFTFFAYYGKIFLP